MIQKTSPSKSQVIQHLENQIRHFEKLLSDTHRHPTKRRVHQLRMTIRKIRATLWICEHGTPRLSFEKLHSDLRYLSRALGKLRELDVAIQDARKFHLKNKKLKRKRKDARQSLSKKTSPRFQRRIEDQLRMAFQAIQRENEQTILSGAALLREKIQPWTQKDLVNDKDFHRLRIVTKKARYILETIGKPTKPLRELQGVLGNGHDLEVLQQFLKSSPQIEKSRKSQYRKARRLVRPALDFAITQLASVAPSKLDHEDARTLDQIRR